MLEGVNINLRAMEKEDISFDHEWLTNLNEIGEYTPIREVSKGDLEKFFNQLSDESKFFVIENKDGTKIGLIGYFPAKAISYSVLELGYYLISSERKKGYCTEAVKIIVDYLFLSKEIVRIQANTDERNTASQKVLEKTGFTKEGLLRKMAFVRGDWINFTLFSILREDWKAPKILKT